MFENPYAQIEKISAIHNPENVALARKIAEKGIVLLKNDGVLPLKEDKKILNMLYLPITGPLPITLYNVFLSDLDKLQLISETSAHAKLLSSLHTTPNELQDARNVLEAIGLLKTYIKKVPFFLDTSRLFWYNK